MCTSTHILSLSHHQGINLKIGKKVEHLCFDGEGELKKWRAAMENVLGLGGVEELLSEDENLGMTGPTSNKFLLSMFNP